MTKLLVRAEILSITKYNKGMTKENVHGRTAFLHIYPKNK